MSDGQPIVAVTPDGQEHEFPAGTPDAVVDAAVQRYLADPVVRDRLSRQMTHDVDPGPIAGRDVARGMLQGQTLGFGDEITGNIVAGAQKAREAVGKAAEVATGTVGANPDLARSEPFQAVRDEVIDAEREGLRKFHEEHPVAATLSTMAGGVMTAKPTLGVTKAIGAPVTGVKGVTATGAAIGGAAGAGAGEGNVLERAPGAVGGALLGAGTGLTISGIGAVGVLAGRRLAPGVENRLAAIAKESGLTPAQIQTRLRALGPKATLADVEAVFQRAADVAAGRLGPTARRVQALIRRDETQFSRLMEPIRRSLGGRDQAAKTVSQLKDLRMEASSPLYEQAFVRGVQNTGRLKDLLSRPETARAWRRVESIGKSDPAVDVALFREGAEPSLRGWQAITEQLADRVETLRRAGSNKSANIIAGLRREILSELDAQSPEFAQARALWAGTKQADDMLEAGGKFLRMSTEEVRDLLKNASDADRAFFRLGAGKAIEQKLAGGTDTNDLARAFRNEEFRAKAFAIFPDQRSALDFINTVRAETIKKTTTNLVGRGSQTQPRQAAERQLGGAQIGVEDMSRAGLARRMLSGLGAPRERTIQGIGELLLSMDPADQARAFAILNARSPDNPLLRLTAPGVAGADLAGQASGR